jgi:hypothetical protein
MDQFAAGGHFFQLALRLGCLAAELGFHLRGV